ncbi:MAG: hypothetical protein ACREQ7_19620 [Candidatus Binatia bacterium]
MLKITTRTDADKRIIELEGKLAGEWVKELERCWGTIAGRRSATVLLKAVTFIDDHGKELLTKIHKSGGQLVAEGCMTKAIVKEIKQGGRT